MSERVNPPEEETPHVTAVKRQLAMKAKTKFRIVDGKVEAYQADAPAHDHEAIIAANRAAMQRARDEKHAARMATAKIGEEIEGRGIYFGTWEPKDNEGKSLGKIFNLFAAPQDLEDILTYTELVEYVSGLENWHGYNGARYATDEDLYKALAADPEQASYDGSWFIPPRELLTGMESNEQAWFRTEAVVQADNLFDYKATEKFNGTYTKTASAVSRHSPQWYWSSTESREGPGDMWSADFSSHSEVVDDPDHFRQSCRLVRLEPKL